MFLSSLEVSSSLQSLSLQESLRVDPFSLFFATNSTGSIQSRAESLHEYLCSKEAGVRGRRLNFAGHSMGGLDVSRKQGVAENRSGKTPVFLCLFCFQSL